MLKTYSENAFYISVGEPWDFVSPDGPGILRGKINYSTSVKERIVYICSCTPFLFGVNEVCQLVLTPRYSNVVEGVFGINESVNCYYSTAGKIINAENVMQFLLEDMNKSFLVGSIHMDNK